MTTNYLIIHGYIITEDGYYPINSDEYKQLIAEETNEYTNK